MLLYTDDSEMSTLGPEAQQSRNTKSYARFTVNAMCLIGVLITLLIILMRRKSY